MRRDIITTVFLFYFLCALLFVYFYPVYYAHDQIIFREISVLERIFSVCFVLLWIALCAGAAYLKQICMFIGGALYALIPYFSSWGINLFSTPADSGDVSIISELMSQFFRRLFELSQAPLVGVSILFEPENGANLTYYLLPILVASYLAVKLFRFYRNAYLAEQLRLDDISPGLKKREHVAVAEHSSQTSKSNGHRKMRVREPGASEFSGKQKETVED